MFLLLQSILLTPQVKSVDKPNIIIIVADDLGYADVGYHGQNTGVQTPNIDALAASGMNFTTAYVTNGVSSPSRAAMLTGRYQQRFGYEDNPGPFRREEGIHPGLPEGVITFPHHLQDIGYTTGLVGKWHLGGEENNSSFPTEQGFDHFYGFLSGAANYYQEHNKDNKIFDGTTPATMEVDYFTDILGNEAIHFIDENADNPYFLYLAYNAVHGPMQADPEILKLYAHIEHEGRRTLCAMQHSMDLSIGRLITHLEKSGQIENTLIFFLSDNGGSNDQTNYSLNLPFRGKKGEFYDGGVHTPFIVRWDKYITPNTQFTGLTSSLDIAPTILTAVGLPVPEIMDGVDLMPYIQGNKTGSPHDMLCWKTNAKWAVRDLEWKLVNTVPKDGTQLFNIATDPYETTNLYDVFPDKVAEMQAKYNAWDAKNEAARWGWSSDTGPYVQHFEEGFEYYAKTKFNASNGSASAIVVENPKKTGCNTSNTVLAITYDDKARPISGAKAPVGQFQKKFRYLHVKVMKPTISTIKARIAGKDGVNDVQESTAPYRTIGEWQDMVFDLQNFPVTSVEIQPNLDKNQGTIYIDDIEFSDDPAERE